MQHSLDISNTSKAINVSANCSSQLKSASPRCKPFVSTRHSPGIATTNNVGLITELRAFYKSTLAPATRPRIRRIQCAAEQGSERTVVVLGGTGRVGSSTVVALLQKDPSLRVVAASRSRESYDKAVRKRPKLADAEFQKVDIDSFESLKRLLEGAALVIHTAGPFQRKEQCLVLEAALATQTRYMDVCDDAEYSQMVKKYSKQAQDVGVPAITSTGIYPGVSNLMAAHMVSIARREYGSDWRLIGPGEQSQAGSKMPKPLEGTPVEPVRVRYSYYTAGSGGVGPTILETSFLLAGTDVVVYRDGKKELQEPVTEARCVDFGKAIGEKWTWLYNLPEVHSTHEFCRVPSVSARFGTDPPLWNWAMIAVARLLPKEFLKDRSKIKWFARLSMPAVQLVDPIAGEKVGMLVEVDLADGTTAAGLFTHKYLNISVGVCVAAFARAMLAGSTEPGVWYPEEPEAVSDRRALLMDAAEGTITFDLNKPLWQLGSDPKQLGMGLYF